MGCDIHVFVEQLDDKGVWCKLDEPSIEIYKDQNGNPVMYDTWYFGRNYALFSMLADVRNGYGFAGCDTGDPVEPISEPRGLPADVSPEIFKEHQEWGYDAHSATYFTLRELRYVDWEKNQITKRGVVDSAGFTQWLNDGQPEWWSGGITGPGIKMITNQEMNQLVKDNAATRSHYTTVQWTTSWTDCVSGEWFDFLDAMGKLSMDDGSDIRMVAWFDN